MATICLAAAAVMLLVDTPTLFRGSAYDRPIQDTLTQATDHRQALLASGVSQEAIDEHHEQAETHVNGLRVRRRVNLYARATMHFGLTLGLFLAWRALRQPPSSPPSNGISTST